MPYEKEEDERSENQPTHEVRAEGKLVWTMPYEKEDDERSENQNCLWRGGGMMILLILDQLLYHSII